MNSKTKEELRFEFGANWQSYLKSHLSNERIDQARKDLLTFVGRNDLTGLRVLDIGSGSGIHSLAAFDSGATEIVSFDYDPDSVAATQGLHAMRGAPKNWTVMQGSVLDPAFMASLGKFDLVYSWGVLHHTGAVWIALEHAAERVATGGLFYIALYDSDWSAESPEFWCRIKQKYTASNQIIRWAYELWYVARFVLHYNPLKLGYLLKYIREYKKNRGMAFYHDVKDWLGGWPMEYTRIYDVIPRLQKKGLILLRSKLGEANTEYLFSDKQLRKDMTCFSPIDLPDPLTWNVKTLRCLNEFSQIDTSQPIYIYGAGKGGKMVKTLLQAEGYKIAGYISTKDNGQLDGLSIFSLDDFMKKDIANPQIVIASAYFDSISYALVQRGITSFFNAYPYIMAQVC